MVLLLDFPLHVQVEEKEEIVEKTVKENIPLSEETVSIDSLSLNLRL
jgi:hypothetical protein